jgi:hypothetical protein
MTTTIGQIRVGRRIYNRNGTFTDPSFPDYVDIFCLTKSSKYGSLGPYVLKNDHGHIMENIWQFSKIYQKVPKVKLPYSRYDKTIIWDHGEEVHMENNIPTLKYKKWRQKGMEASYPVRYPVGFSNRHLCIGSIKSSEYNKCIMDKNYVPKLLSYVDARKEIYLKNYLKLVKKEKDFWGLVNMVKSGKNILIIEVDGPHQDHLDYYKSKYGVSDDFIEHNTILCTPENMDIMLNDTKFPFGHGYCLGISITQELDKLE